MAIARPSALFGFGRHKTKLLNRFLYAVTREEEISLDPPVNDRIDFLHAADFSNAVVKIIENIFGKHLIFLLVARF